MKRLIVAFALLLGAWTVTDAGILHKQSGADCITEAGSGCGQTYWVSGSGDDTCTGTKRLLPTESYPDCARRQPQSLIDDGLLNAGDDVLMLAGTYEPLIFSVGPRFRAAPSNPTLVGADATTAASAVIIDSGAEEQAIYVIGGPGSNSRNSHIRFLDMTVNCGTKKCIKIGQWDGEDTNDIWIERITAAEVDNMTGSTAGSDGNAAIAVGWGTGTHIHNFTAIGNADPNTADSVTINGNGVTMYGTVAGCLNMIGSPNSHIADTNCQNFQGWAVGGIADNTIIERSKFVNIAGESDDGAFQVYGRENVVIKRNVMDTVCTGDQGAVFRVRETGAGPASLDLYNNTIVTPSQGYCADGSARGRMLLLNSGGSTHVRSWNNIITGYGNTNYEGTSSSHPSGAHVLEVCAAEVIIDNNVYFEIDTDPINSNKAGCIGQIDVTNLAADPNLNATTYAPADADAICSFGNTIIQDVFGLTGDAWAGAVYCQPQFLGGPQGWAGDADLPQTFPTIPIGTPIPN